MKASLDQLGRAGVPLSWLVIPWEWGTNQRMREVINFETLPGLLTNTESMGTDFKMQVL